MSFDAEFWVAVSFILFIAGLAYLGVFKSLHGLLDDRAKRIQDDLAEARRLKEEAEAVVAQYRLKRQEAEREAEAIIAGARAEAERLAAESSAKAQEFVARRTALAETKIAQAEQQALAEVRAAAADAAVAAAERVLKDSLKGKAADQLVERGIADLRSKLN